MLPPEPWVIELRAWLAGRTEVQFAVLYAAFRPRIPRSEASHVAYWPCHRERMGTLPLDRQIDIGVRRLLRIQLKSLGWRSVGGRGMPGRYVPPPPMRSVRCGRCQQSFEQPRASRGRRCPTCRALRLAS